MRERTMRELTLHFFRRLFENDVVQSGDDMVTTVVRALAVVAAPGLMFAFWLQNQYPQRTHWGRIEDEYFFVMFSFVAMAGVAIFEWEMLFPDHLDFLVLTPLPLRRWQMPATKAAALVMFLGLFLGAANLFGLLMLPALTKTNIGRQFAAQATATLSAGIFGVLAVMLLGRVLVSVVPARLFRGISLIFRMLTVTTLGLLVIHYARFGDSMPGLLADGGQRMRWFPTFWFLGLYQAIQYGGSAPEFAHSMAHRADTALGVVLLGVVVVYPVAWDRMRRLAVEEQVNRGAGSGHWTRAAIHAIVRRPEERAVFHFIGKTMTRNSRYHLYMAVYFGAGLALAISCITHVRTVGGVAEPGLSEFGLHAVMPLLVFWVVAGLKMAFAFPLQLHAKWIFRTTGASLSRCVAAASKWALACGLAVVILVVIFLACLHLSGRELLVQTVFGVCLCAVLVDAFFFAQTSVPFSQPRHPGRTSLPLVLTLYLGILTPFIFGMILLELKVEKNLFLLIGVVGLVPVVHQLLRKLRDRAVLIEEERENADGEFQLLGLCGDLTA
ncbi:MAG TPA: hypothetical protein VGU25_17170 [Acidobacteriaceae bacterium]|nr:hypothetical protein [Acidobacteriaceae bacterium]